MEEQKLYHYSNVTVTPSINMKVEKNSRGYNYEVSVVGVESVDDALKLIKEAEAKLKAEYGEKPE